MTYEVAGEPVVRLDQFFLTDIDEATFPHYYGFMNEVGGWYIMREASNSEFRIARAQFGAAGRYSEAWNNRTTLVYLLYFATF